MTELHPTNRRRTLTEPFSTTLPVSQASERCPIEVEREGGQSPGRSSHLDWTTLVIWGFVVVSFAALVLCGFIIGAKCHGDWPL